MLIYRRFRFKICLHRRRRSAAFFSILFLRRPVFYGILFIFFLFISLRSPVTENWTPPRLYTPLCRDLVARRVHVGRVEIASGRTPHPRADIAVAYFRTKLHFYQDGPRWSGSDAIDGRVSPVAARVDEDMIVVLSAPLSPPPAASGYFAETRMLSHFRRMQYCQVNSDDDDDGDDRTNGEFGDSKMELDPVRQFTRACPHIDR